MKKRVLIAPLDWGLGHATRCIPIIEELLKRNHEVLIASSGSALKLLRKEFPVLEFFALPAYKIQYPREGSFIFSIALQTPRILSVISSEHRRVQKIVRDNKIDLILSDNRYGCWSDEIPSIFISHQLNLQVTDGWRLLKPIVDTLHNSMIKKFDQCWIPDDPKLNLAGALTKNDKLKVKHIGVLSRFKKESIELKYDLAIVLSGPEPQRTMLEEIIFDQIEDQLIKIIVVRGVVEGLGNWKEEGNGDLVIANFLYGKRLEEIMNQSKLIISRSGYSTIMDLARLGKKAILIPTPGQTEQEYLAAQMKSRNIFYSVNQNSFDLYKALLESVSFTGFSNIESESKLLSLALDEVLK